MWNAELQRTCVSQHLKCTILRKDSRSLEVSVLLDECDFWLSSDLLFNADVYRCAQKIPLLPTARTDLTCDLTWPDLNWIDLSWTEPSGGISWGLFLLTPQEKTFIYLYLSSNLAKTFRICSYEENKQYNKNFLFMSGKWWAFVIMMDRSQKWEEAFKGGVNSFWMTSHLLILEISER